VGIPLADGHDELLFIQAAWWGAYRSGWVPGHESTPNWPDFAAEADERSRVRRWRLDADDLARALQRALLAAPPAQTA
jgi:hypothetical protein